MNFAKVDMGLIVPTCSLLIEDSRILSFVKYTGILVSCLIILGCAETRPVQTLGQPVSVKSQLLAACERGSNMLDWASCNDYAFELAKSSPAEADGYYKKACDHQVGRGCSNLGYNSVDRPSSPD
jgi:hypothetical protein